MNQPRTRGPIARLFIGLWDAVNFSRRLVFNLLFLLVVFYLIILLPVSIVGSLIERRLRYAGFGS